MKSFSALVTIVFLLSTTQNSFSEECEDLRLNIENFWRIKKGEMPRSFELTPMALTTRNPTTTMPQLAMVCRKDTNDGGVQVFGDGTPFNATLEADECRLIFVLGVKSITAEFAPNFEGEEACGSFQVIR